MFEKFFKLINFTDNPKIESVERFCEYFEGKSFLKGLYRMFKKDETSKWNDIVLDAFTNCGFDFDCFGYDWLGRIFALNKDTKEVLMFEPGTGEVYGTQSNFEEFHNDYISNMHKEILSSSAFYDWLKANNVESLTYKQCAGYKIPLFLNGDDTLDNLELSDMEVYWEILSPLIKL